VPATEQLRGSGTVELGFPSGDAMNSCLHPVYVRGQVFLAAGRGLSSHCQLHGSL
jgi:hypothetical protein